MATPEQIEDLIALIFGMGPLTGEDGFIDATAAGIEEALYALPRAEAVQAARDRAEALRVILQRAESKRIAAIIVDGLESGTEFDAMQRRIRDHIGLRDDQLRKLDKLEEAMRLQGLEDEQIAAALKRERKKLLNDRAALIAGHEIANATEEGNYRAALAAGATHKMNIDAGDGRVAKVCQACTAQGVIPIDEVFASGAQRPPHHVKCRCAATTFTNPSDDRVDRMNQMNEDRLKQIQDAQEGQDFDEAMDEGG